MLKRAASFKYWQLIIQEKSSAMCVYIYIYTYIHTYLPGVIPDKAGKPESFDKVSDVRHSKHS